MQQVDTQTTTSAVPGAGMPAGPHSQSLTFKLQAETFALPAALVQEIIDVVPGSAVPGAPPIASRVINFRGRIIPIVDLRVAFGMSPTEPTIDSRYVVVDMMLGGVSILCGLYTDKVNEVTSFQAESIEDTPVVGMRWPPNYVCGLIRHNGGIIVLPDIPAILSPITDRTGSVPGTTQIL